MAALTSGQNNTVVSFSNVSIVLSLDGDTFTDRLLEHVNAETKEEPETSDVNFLIICSAFSNNCVYFSCCVHKDLYLWTTNDWKLICKRQINRSASALRFTKNDDKLAVADKSGDVFLFSVENFENHGELILGHISMLLDILLTPNGKYIITCDRDEKIRVSCYPNAYNVKSYCLGHEEFVTSLCILPNNENVLISGSGDGTIRFWDYENGKELLCHNCTEPNLDFNDTKAVISKIVTFKVKETNSILCTQLDSFKGILIYNIVNNKSEIKCSYIQHIELDTQPWSVSISSTNLFIFKQNINECLSTYSFSNEKNEFLLNNSFNNKINLNKYKEQLENVFKLNIDINTLYKRRIDNVQDYIKRKLDRIETNSKKSKHLTVSQEMN